MGVFAPTTGLGEIYIEGSQRYSGSYGHIFILPMTYAITWLPFLLQMVKKSLILIFHSNMISLVNVTKWKRPHYPAPNDYCVTWHQITASFLIVKVLVFYFIF